MADSINKLTIIDPNDIEGQNSSSNIFKQYEDLNIYVQLKARRKGRTVLTANSNGNTTETSDDINISFIGGNKADSERALTTNYTLLTTSFDTDGENDMDENFGISDITIEFDTAYTPLITINFIDVRGSAIFQNDKKIKNNKSKYSIFFNLPYPIFELTVKGYYGLPLKYCLHMTSFSSRFNAQTGNFEITCKFIGYTYAMLADMLIGYLKVIEFTGIGKSIYNTIGGGVQTISQLVAAIDALNTGIKKLSQTNESAKILNDIESRYTFLNRIKEQIVILGTEIDINDGQKVTTNVQKLELYKVITNTQIDQQSNSINNYNKEIETIVKDFNGEDGKFNININENDFKLNVGKQTLNNVFIAQNPPSDEYEELSEIFNDRYGQGAVIAIFQYYNMINAIKKIDEYETKLNELKGQQTVEITNEINRIASEDVGLDTTINNITKIFTTAIDVFIRTIHKVSTAAEQPTNTKRNDLLKSAFGDDIAKTDYLNNNTTYYAWPQYNEKDTNIKKGYNNAYVEKYLGTAEKIKGNQSSIDELVFIDDLLNAFIIEKQQSNLREIALANTEKNWIPVNPSDTRLFGVENAPYTRINNQYDVETLKILILTRAMTFLAYSNSSLTKDEIAQMATIETNSLLEIPEKKLILNISNLTTDDFILKTVGKFGTDTPVIQGNANSEYLYNFLRYPDNFVILPVQSDFNPDEITYTKWPNPAIPTQTIFKSLVDKSETNVFLTNYSNNSGSGVIDGGVYLKIFSLDEFTTSLDLKDSVDTTTLIQLSEIEKDTPDIATAGYNPFGGIYGIQEFVKMNYDTDIGEGELKYVFYRDNVYNTLSDKRTVNDKTDFDLDNNIIIPIFTKEYGKNNYRTLDSGKSKTAIEKLKKIYDDKNLSKNRFFLVKNDLNNKNIPFINMSFVGSSTKLNHKIEFEWDRLFTGGNIETFSLFGSSFYYDQEDNTTNKKIIGNYSKALLFLNTLPFYENENNVIKLFPNDIINLFNKKSGFIHAPKLWCAFIGGMLWRNDKTEYVLDNNSKIIDGGSGVIDPIDWREIYELNTLSNNFKPKRNEYINILILTQLTLNPFENKFEQYMENLPIQVKNEFKKIFFNFVNNGDWINIKNNLEIHNGNSTTFKNKINILHTLITTTKEFNQTILKNNFVLDNYKSFRFYYFDQSEITYFVDLELDGEKNIVNTIINLMREEVVIANNSYKIWEDSSQSTGRRAEIKTSKDDLNHYISTMLDILKGKQPEILNENEKILSDIFGTTNLNDIKLNLYKYCKNINDKWIAGNDNEDKILYSCNNQANNRFLIDSFRFVSRSFHDIGDVFYTNPKNIPDNLKNNPNISFYNFYSTYLTDHNFDFIPLPAFINYRSIKDIEKSVFTTYPEYVSDKNSLITPITGPSFVCIYSGGKSNSLDTGVNDEYRNDGFDFTEGNIPEDFTSNNAGDGLAVFKVNYGQQNQNIFKNIELDQNEFRETQESLQITSDMVDNKSENKRTFVGQNLYNVYNVRSYSAKIEMLGNPMIQPMMYFQLNNIPMFHGAYLITNVKHQIKPNHMTTNFTGQRIKYSQLPLLDKSDIFIGMANSLGFNIDKNYIPGETVSQGLLPTNNLNFVPPIQDKYVLGDEVNLHSTGSKRKHKGVDIKIVSGTKVYAIADGTIETIKVQNSKGGSVGWGLHILINHGQLSDGRYYKSLYGHLSDIDSNILPNVKNSNLDINIYNSIITPSGYSVGKKVKKNQLLGLSGGIEDNNDTLGNKGVYNFAGTSRGAHLHFEIRSSDNESVQFLNADVVDPVGAIPLIGGKTQSSNQRISSQLIYEELKKQLGYPDEAIAGIMGNLYQESRFFTTAENKSDAGLGLAQWTNKRRTEFEQYCIKNNLNTTSYISQINFLKYELTTKRTNGDGGLWIYTGNNLKNNKSVAPTSANDVSDATTIFYVTYEGGTLGWGNFSISKVKARLDELRNAESKNDSYPKRIKFAKAFLEMIKNNNFSYPE
jgi:hypothetical protein